MSCAQRVQTVAGAVIGLCAVAGVISGCRSAPQKVQAGIAEARASTISELEGRHVVPSPNEISIDNRRPLKLPLVNPRIIVKKGERRLFLYSNGIAVREFRVALGFSPDGDKVRQGDGRTPEGTFYVCVKNNRSMFHLSLGLSYPNDDDAERGLRDKIITRRQYERIKSAIRRKQKPPWDTRLGGEIFIHGNGTSGDWTWGCVALENTDINELFDATPMGTTVVIEP